MATVLYVTAHPLDHSASYSLSVGQEFVQAYREANPNDEVVHFIYFLQTEYPPNRC